MSAGIIVAVAADLHESVHAPSGGPDWSYLVVGVLGVVGSLYAAWRSAKTERRGQDLERQAGIGADWEKLTEGMWRQINADHDRIEALEKSDRAKGAQIELLTSEVASLKRWKAAALRYIAALISTITELGGTPPAPPADYTDH